MSDGGEHRSPRIGARLRLPDAEGIVLGRWQPGGLSRLFAVGCLVAFLVIGSLLAFGGAAASDRISGIGFLVLAPLAIWLVWGRPYLILTDRQLVVQNPLVGFVVPLDAVKEVAPGGWGIVFDVRGRSSPIIAMAVPKANISFMLRRSVRADEVAAAVLEAAEHRPH